MSSFEMEWGDIEAADERDHEMDERAKRRGK